MVDRRRERKAETSDDRKNGSRESLARLRDRMEIR